MNLCQNVKFQTNGSRIIANANGHIHTFTLLDDETSNLGLYENVFFKLGENDV